jgi:hypothetical protein
VTTVDRARLRPVDCPDLVRLGPRGDGGYVVPGVAVERAVCLLSLGVKQDWSFERAFVAANARSRVIGVDPSVGPALFARQIATNAAGIVAAALSGRQRERRRRAAVLSRSIDYFRFFGRRHRHVRRRAVGAPRAASDISLGGLLDDVAQAPPLGVFLKMDIEGGEYDVVPHVAAHAARFAAVVVEFHGIGRRPARFVDALDALESGFRIVHVHGNNYGGYAPEVGLPDVLEVTWLNLELLPGPTTASPHRYPRPGLDWPNTPSRPDLDLRFDKDGPGR